MSKALYFFLLVLTILILVCSCDCQKRTNNLIEINASFMYYACGDGSDDMRVNYVKDTNYSFLLKKDIDPEILNGASEVMSLIYTDFANDFGITYKMEGYISDCAEYGCDDNVPQFWITKISKMNGIEIKIN